MGFHVSDEAQDAAIKCTKGLSCLKGEEKDICPVEKCIDGKVHFVKCLNDGYCTYQHSFGDGYFCSCPVRQEIFNKYQK